MVLRADAVAVRQGHRDLLPATSFSVAPGELVVLAGDPGHGHTLLALALAGRLDRYDGIVTLDDSRDRSARQAAVALVDVPGVSEPDANLPFRTVVGEELAMAGFPAGRAVVNRWLGEEGYGAHADLTMEALPPAVRTTALARLAELRRGVHYLVIPMPERNGGLPHDWLDLADAATERGFGVVVSVSLGAAERLGRPALTLGNALEEQQ
ncbi:MAG TPA: hypothetical protein VF426_03620 [Marmoricola sp.]